MLEKLKEKILDKKAVVGVVGLGYVGLPLAVEYAKSGYKVIGIDLDEKKVKSINSCISYIPDVSTQELREVVKNGRLKATKDYRAVAQLDAVIICVPTPLRKTKEPDISFVFSAIDNISKHIKKGTLVSLESTTYPGTTEEVLQPILEKRGLKIDKDFFLAFSPERVDPSNKQYRTKDIPKVIGGVTKASTELAKLLYSQVVVKVIPVSSAQVAEMVKVYENTFRAVNIGLVNELALMCEKMGLDVWEVIEAAKTKPFGFMPFYPGPGLGGHCLPIDPLYLSWRARSYGFEARFIELASQINSDMPHFVVRKTGDFLNEKGKSVKNSKILVLGVAYKRDVNDLRESPAIEIIKLLEEKGAKIKYHDPFVPQMDLEPKIIRSVKLTKQAVASADCVIIITDHTNIDYDMVVKNAKLIFDTRNVLKNFKNYREKIKKI